MPIYVLYALIVICVLLPAILVFAAAALIDKGHILACFSCAIGWVCINGVLCGLVFYVISSKGDGAAMYGILITALIENIIAVSLAVKKDY